MAVRNELIPVLEGMCVRKKDPLSHLIPIKVQERAMVGFVPLNSAIVSCGELQYLRGSDVIAFEIGLLLPRGFIDCGSTGVPVIAIKRYSERKLLRRDILQGVIEVLNSPLPTRDGPRHCPSRVLVIRHQADEVY